MTAECSLEHIPQNKIYFIYSFLIIASLDIILWALNKTNSRWFKLHVLANLCTVIFSYRDFFNVILNPLDNYSRAPSSLLPPNMTLALHVYHALLFNNLTTIDWVHHIVMMTILLPTFWCPYPPLTNSIIFVTNGLPGGIDYFLLILVKEGIINRVTEKRINSKLNIWIRGPFILIAAYVIYIQWRYSPTERPLFIIIAIIAALYWNAQYFTERVVYNWGNTALEKTPSFC